MEDNHFEVSIENLVDEKLKAILKKVIILDDNDNEWAARLVHIDEDEIILTIDKDS